MKNIARSILFNSFSLFIISLILSGIKIVGGIQNIFLCGVVLSMLMLIGKPIIGILTFPLNLVTFGLYTLIGGIVSNAILFYILSVGIKQFIVQPFTTQAMQVAGITIPSLQVNELFAFVACGVAYILVRGALSWVI